MALQILSGKKCLGSSPPICIYQKFARCQDNFGKLIILGKKPNQTDHNSWQRANLFLCKQHGSCNSPIWSFWRSFIKNIYDLFGLAFGCAFLPPKSQKLTKGIGYNP
jgi:hypothetical protein